MMKVSLMAGQIRDLLKDVTMEIKREIYSISFTMKDITINGDWSVPICSVNHFRKDLISAIEKYCTKENIDFE